MARWEPPNRAATVTSALAALASLGAAVVVRAGPAAGRAESLAHHISDADTRETATAKVAVDHVVETIVTETDLAWYRRSPGGRLRP